MSSMMMIPGKESLYLSPGGSLFLTREPSKETYSPEMLLLDRGKAQDWLDESDAPDSAYEAAGIEVEAG